MVPLSAEMKAMSRARVLAWSSEMALKWALAEAQVPYLVKESVQKWEQATALKSADSLGDELG